MPFPEMNLNLAEALSERGYAEPTPVQSAVLAPGLEERDLLVSAQTGSGKTVAFGAAVAPTLLGGEARFGPPGAPLALVIAPTRELALQVERLPLGEVAVTVRRTAGDRRIPDRQGTRDPHC